MTLEVKEKPVREVRFGNVRVSIWANRNQQGELFHSFSLERSYRDENGDWKSHKISLGLNEVAKVREALGKAYEDYYALPRVKQESVITDQRQNEVGGIQ